MYTLCTAIAWLFLLVQQDGLTIEELLSSPDKVTIGGSDLILRPAVWLSLMPSNEGHNEQPLIVAARVLTAAKDTFPKGVSLDEVWLIDGNRVWNSLFTDEARTDRPHILSRIARDWPSLALETRVTVVVRLRNTDGKYYYLRAPDQTIRGAY